MRSLEAWATHIWYLKAGSRLAKALEARNDAYNAKKRLGEAHPEGPPRRGLTYVLLDEFLLKAAKAADAGEAGKQFAEFHEGLKEPWELEQKSMQYMTAYKVKDGGMIFKMRPYRSAYQVWTPAIQWLDTQIKAEGGEDRPDQAPPSAKSKELWAWAYRG